MSGLTVREYRGLVGFSALRERWLALCAANEQARFHHSFHWYHSCARHLCPDPDEIRLLVVEREGALCAVLPLEERQAVIRRLPFRVWCMPNVDSMPTADFAVARGEDRAAVLQAIVAYLGEKTDGARILLLRGFPLEPGDSIIVGKASGRVFSQPSGPCDFIRTTGSYEELLGGLKRNFRGNLRKARNKLAQIPGVEFRTDSGDRIAEAVQIFMRVEARSWKGASGTATAVALNPRVTAFYASLMADAEGAEVRSLWVEGVCIATELCLRTGRELAVLKIGYDEDFARLAPGQLLLETTIKDCCARSDVDEVNLVSDTSWHLDWNPVRRAQGLVYVAFSGLIGTCALALLRIRAAKIQVDAVVSSAERVTL